MPQIAPAAGVKWSTMKGMYKLGYTNIREMIQASKLYNANKKTKAFVGLGAGVGVGGIATLGGVAYNSQLKKRTERRAEAQRLIDEYLGE